MTRFRRSARKLTRLVAILLGFAVGGHASEAQVLFQEVQKDVVSDRLEQQLIALISFSTSPGVTGGRLDVAREDPAPDYSLRKLTFGGDQFVSTAGDAVDLFLEGAVGLLDTDEKSFDLGTVGGTPVAVQTDRTIAFGRVGLGPAIRLDDRFQLLPIASVAISRFENETGLGEIQGGGGSIGEILTRDFTLWGASYAGSLQLRFDDTVGAGRLEARAALTQSYTDIFDAPVEQLNVSGWTTTITAGARWSVPTDIAVFGQPLGWNLFSTATVPAGDGRRALGFRFLGEVGAGLDFDLRDKDLFFVEAIRPRVSILFGDNVSGFNVGARVRF